MSCDYCFLLYCALLPSPLQNCYLISKFYVETWNVLQFCGIFIFALFFFVWAHIEKYYLWELRFSILCILMSLLLLTFRLRNNSQLAPFLLITFFLWFLCRLDRINVCVHCFFWMARTAWDFLAVARRSRDLNNILSITVIIVYSNKYLFFITLQWPWIFKMNHKGCLQFHVFLKNLL